MLYFLVVILYEEPTLKHKFGESYRRYCKDVPRWIPSRIKK
jgi:protein-S-isoprenylcysteine O-methyltransferase Ste14